MSETPVIVSMGRNHSQVEIGMSCRALQAVQRASITPQLPLTASAALERSNASTSVAVPMQPTPIAPAARKPAGIRSHAAAAQSASALHMVIE